MSDRTLAVVALAFAALALAGCGPMPRQAEMFKGQKIDGTLKASNDLSEARERQLGDAFIGREIVFRVPWHEYAVVDPDPDLAQPCPLKHITSSTGRTAIKVPAGTAERGGLVLAARPGETATIIGLRFLRNLTLLVARKPDGALVFVEVGMPRRRTIIGTKAGDCTDRSPISDENLTVGWLEDVLAVAVGELVAPATARADVALPTPQKGLELSPPPVASAAPRSQPSVALIDAGAEPPRVKRGEVVRLGMAFRVEAGGAPEVRIEESYDLTFEGKRLPNFPVQRARPRGAGEHRSEYSQQIPRAAAPGSYRFRAEVCLEGACSSRIARFEIAD